MCLIHHVEIKAGPRKRLGVLPGLQTAGPTSPSLRILSSPAVTEAPGPSSSPWKLLTDLSVCPPDTRGILPLLFLTRVKAQLVCTQRSLLRQDVWSGSCLLCQPFSPQPRGGGCFILTSWIGSSFIASRNDAWLKAYGVNQQKTFPVVKLGSGS